jgi:hypothetical protein
MRQRRNCFDFVIAALRRRRMGEHNAAVSSGCARRQVAFTVLESDRPSFERHVMLTQAS